MSADVIVYLAGLSIAGVRCLKLEFLAFLLRFTPFLRQTWALTCLAKVPGVENSCKQCEHLDDMIGKDD